MDYRKREELMKRLEDERRQALIDLEVRKFALQIDIWEKEQRAEFPGSAAD